MPSQTRLLLTAFSLSLFIAGCGRSNISEEISPGKSATAVKIETLAASEAPVRYTFAGVVRARLNTTLSSKVTGQVLEVNAREGDRVHKGQVLVTIDARELTANESAAAAGVKSAASDLTSARLNAEMQAGADRARVDVATSHLSAAKAALKAAQAKLELVLAGPRAEDREQAKQRTAAAQSQLKLAQSDLARSKTLYNAGAISRQQLDHMETAYEVAKTDFVSAREAEKAMFQGSRPEEIRSAREARNQAEAEAVQAQASLAEAKALVTQTDIQREQISRALAQQAQASAGLSGSRATLSETVIHAPFDGVVASRRVDPGTMAAPGTSLMTLVSNDLRLEVSVPESSIGSIAIGMPAEVEVGEVGRSFPAHVIEIVPEGDASAHTFNVKLQIQENELKPGMYGKAIFKIGSRKSLLLPETAVIWRDGLPYVFAVNGKETNLRVLTLGEKLDSKIEILSGLAAGERYLSAPPAGLSDGAAIEEARASK